jgi:V/A-type H+-transporting ATPase subunit K
MSIVIAIVIISWLTLLGSGVYFELRPIRDGATAKRWWPRAVASNVIVFAGAMLALFAAGLNDAMAQTADSAATGEMSIGFGLALIGVGLPTCVATIGAGMAVGTVGASAMALIGEKPEMFGRTLIYIGLAEGIAIYGLVVSILLLGKVG